MERDAFLARVAASLKGTPALPAVRCTPDLARVDESADEISARFVAEFEAVGGRFLDVLSLAEAADALRSLIGDEQSIITWNRGEYAAWGIDWLWDDLHAQQLAPGHSESATAFIDASIGITTVDRAVAETGSLVLSTSTTRSRSVSLVPRRHIALLRSDQIVRRLGEAFATLGSTQSFPSAAYVITGPSRSADIENDLTIGVHGPAEVTIICTRS